MKLDIIPRLRGKWIAFKEAHGKKALQYFEAICFIAFIFMALGLFWDYSWKLLGASAGIYFIALEVAAKITNWVRIKTMLGK